MERLGREGRLRLVGGTGQVGPSAGESAASIHPDFAEQRVKLLAFVMRRVRDPALADDIVQETFAKALAYQLRTEVRYPTALNFRIAENLVRSHYRGLRHGRSEPLDEDLACEKPAADELLIDKERLAMFTALLGRMPPLRREVFIRRRLHGESHAQISAALDLTPSAVEKHLVRAMSWLSEASSKVAATRRGAR